MACAPLSIQSVCLSPYGGVALARSSRPVPSNAIDTLRSGVFITTIHAPLPPKKSVDSSGESYAMNTPTRSSVAVVRDPATDPRSSPTTVYESCTRSIKKVWMSQQDYEWWCEWAAHLESAARGQCPDDMYQVCPDDIALKCSRAIPKHPDAWLQLASVYVDHIVRTQKCYEQYAQAAMRAVETSARCVFRDRHSCIHSIMIGPHTSDDEIYYDVSDIYDSMNVLDEWCAMAVLYLRPVHLTKMTADKFSALHDAVSHVPTFKSAKRPR